MNTPAVRSVHRQVGQDAAAAGAAAGAARPVRTKISDVLCIYLKTAKTILDNSKQTRISQNLQKCLGV